MLVLVMLPCVPGLTFLAAGWVREPRQSKGIFTARNREAFLNARRQADGLYRAGAAVLGAGVLCGVFVGWKFMRCREPDADEPK